MLCVCSRATLYLASLSALLTFRAPAPRDLASNLRQGWPAGREHCRWCKCVTSPQNCQLNIFRRQLQGCLEGAFRKFKAIISPSADADSMEVDECVLRTSFDYVLS